MKAEAGHWLTAAPGLGVRPYSAAVIFSNRFCIAAKYTTGITTRVSRVETGRPKIIAVCSCATYAAGE